MSTFDLKLKILQTSIKLVSMRKILLLTSLVIVHSSIFGQIKLDYTTLSGSTVIKPTFENLTRLVNSDFQEFKTAMNFYSYQPTTDGAGYCANSLKFTYIITKKMGNTTLMFANDDYGLVSSLRKEIKALFPGLNPSFQNDFEIYSIRLKNNTQVKIAIQEDLSGFSGVSIFLN